MPRFNMVKQMQDSKAVIGLNMLTLWKDAARCARGSSRYLDARGRHVDPVVAGTFDFEKTGEAQTMIVERRNLGKVVLTP